MGTTQSVVTPKDANTSEAPQEDAADLAPIGKFARWAARREHPPIPGVPEENEVERASRRALREATEKDFLCRLANYIRDGMLRVRNPLNGAPYAPALPHLDPADPTWEMDDAECDHALELLGQLVRTDGNIRLQSAAANEAEAREVQKRQARGFYTLREAARKVAEANPGVQESELLADMVAAARTRTQVIRKPATQAPDEKVGSLRAFWHWMRPTDLDALFAAWGVTYRFPKNAVPAPEAEFPPKASGQDADGGTEEANKKWTPERIEEMRDARQTEIGKRHLSESLAS